MWISLKKHLTLKSLYIQKPIPGLAFSKLCIYHANLKIDYSVIGLTLLTQLIKIFSIDFRCPDWSQDGEQPMNEGWEEWGNVVGQWCQHQVLSHLIIQFLFSKLPNLDTTYFAHEGILWVSVVNTMSDNNADQRGRFCIGMYRTVYNLIWSIENKSKMLPFADV